MAEAFLNDLGREKFIAESAGLEPGSLNQTVVKVMAEIGYDISGNKTKSVFDIFRNGKTYDYVVTVCDPEAAERCPIFPGIVKRLHWGFKDPSSFQGSENDKLEFARKVRDEIRIEIEKFVKEA
jgi:arsenate reductase